MARVIWVVGIYASAGVLWLALTIYPARWLDLPWWATLALALFWIWQIELARPAAKRIVRDGLAYLDDWRAALRP